MSVNGLIKARILLKECLSQFNNKQENVVQTLYNVYPDEMIEIEKLLASQFKAEQKQSAGEIVKGLAEWSLRWPRNVTYSSSRQPQMDGELIALEEKAKAWLDETPNKQTV